MLDPVFEQYQMSFVAVSGQQRGKLEHGFFSAAAAQIGGDKGKFQCGLEKTLGGCFASASATACQTVSMRMSLIDASVEQVLPASG